MDLAEYQKNARNTAVYPKSLEGGIYYPALGLAGEVGELLNKIKKTARDGRKLEIDDVKSELGDVLWYVSQIAEEMGISLDEVASSNIEKLRSRMERGVISGSGDRR